MLKIISLILCLSLTINNSSASVNRKVNVDDLFKADNSTFILPIANGGSGQSSTNDSLNAFLPTQTGNNGKVLQTDGTNSSWVTGGGGASWGSITGTLSSQTDLDTALGLKADTSSLATVATSGAYADLSGLPTIPTHDVMVGDTGSGGTQGEVPAPATGDAEKFLKGDATFGHPQETNLVRNASVIQNTSTTTSGNGRTYLVDTSSGSRTITFPQCGTLNAPEGIINTIKNRVGGTAPVKVVPNAADTIDGKTVDYVDISYSKQYQCNGALGEWNEINTQSVGTIVQRVLIGTMKMTGCSSNHSSVQSSNTTYQSMATSLPTGCSKAFTGSLIASANANKPDFKVASLGVGDYSIEVNGKLQVRAAANATTNTGFYRFTDGTTTALEDFPVQVYSDYGAAFAGGMTQYFNYSSPQVDKTWELFSHGDGDAGAQQYLYATNTFPLVVKLWFTPTQSQQVVSSAQADYSGITYDLTSSNTQGVGTPTSAKCIHDRVGGNLILNCKLTAGTSTGSEARINLPNGLLTADTTRLPSIAYVGSGANIGTNGVTTIVLAQPSVGYINFSRQYEAGSLPQLTPAIGTDFLGTGNTVSFTATIPIQDWKSSGRAPVLIGSVTSNSSNAERIERLTINAQCTASPCTISSQSSSWATVTRASIGSYTLVPASGVFSAVPTCSVQVIQRSAYAIIQMNPTQTNISLPFTSHDSNAGLALIDEGFMIMCMGAR